MKEISGSRKLQTNSPSMFGVEDYWKRHVCLLMHHRWTSPVPTNVLQSFLCSDKGAKQLGECAAVKKKFDEWIK